jgi:hypothetical protein
VISNLSVDSDFDGSLLIRQDSLPTNVEVEGVFPIAEESLALCLHDGWLIQRCRRIALYQLEEFEDGPRINAHEMENAVVPDNHFHSGNLVLQDANFLARVLTAWAAIWM